MGRQLFAVQRPLMVTDAVRDLYLARWGAPSRNARFRVDGLDVEIFKWSANVTPEGVNLFANVGASVRSLAGRDLG
jgi:hypothetical protein